MLSIQVSGYTKQCDPITGGVSRVFVFDPADMDWTQGAITAPGLAAYTAVGLHGGATILGGSGFFEIGFDYLEGDYKGTPSVKGSSQKYTHQLTLHLPEMSQRLTNFIFAMQSALTCTSLGFVIVLNTGKIFIMGEKIVNAAELAAVFRVIMGDGGEIGSGKAMDDPQGATVVFKGDYGRPLNEFTGGIAAITALAGTPIF